MTRPPTARHRAGYVGREYFTTGPDDGTYSADPSDYWHHADGDTVGAIIRRHQPYRTRSGRIVYAPRMVRQYGTVRDLRRLARAAERAGRV
jgi:hypothetical protein